MVKLIADDYVQDLYGSLLERPSMGIHDDDVREIISHFEGWEYTVVGVGERIKRTFTRSLPELPVPPIADFFQTRRREIEQTPELLTIQVKNTVAEDMLRVISTEAAIQAQLQAN